MVDDGVVRAQPGGAQAPDEHRPAAPPPLGGTGESAADERRQTAADLLPSVSLPKGGGAIRGMGEKFSVNPVTGTGALSIPVPLSPGRSGFTPQLSLAYDSGAGNGPFGFGWSLPVPSITRKTDKGLPRYCDGDECDVFILSGAEDLVPVLDDTGARVHVSRVVHGTTYEILLYRPRIEGLFARIERWVDTSTGLSHWRSISRDNVTTLYGPEEHSRVADPADPARIFSWLICRTWDDKGNLTVYDYLADDSRGVDLGRPHEANRTEPVRAAQRYLKAARYANTEPYFPGWAQDGTETPLPASWHFQLVIDYGDHQPDAPRPDPDQSWPVRPDPFSTYRAGFEVRTYRRAQRLLVFHNFPAEPGVGAGCLVRSADLTYSDQQSPADPRNPIYTMLASVTQTGHRRSGAGYLSRSLPPLEFDYSQPQISPDVLELDAGSLAGLPRGVDGSQYRWADIDGEGLSGVLADLGGAWGYKRNLSPINQVTQPDGSLATRARLGPLETLPALPSRSGLAGQQLLDLDGSGRLDLAQLGAPAPGFFKRNQNESWEPFRPFRSLPGIDWDDPNVRFADLTGNGLADILFTEDGLFTLYPSLGDDGFDRAQMVRTGWDEERGPQLVLADGTSTVLLADMSGDGLSDLLRVRNGEVCYWPNLGYGRFGPKVTMDRAPRFTDGEAFDPRRVRLADIDGSGTTDLLYIGADGVQACFNQSGNAWSAPHSLAVFPGADSLSDVEVTDLLGIGTACLVWSSPLPGEAGRQMRYVDLMAGTKPHLLIGVRNNLGAETRLRYAPSTRFYLADKAAGQPWVTRLPHVVHVVERAETLDWIGRNRAVTRYDYHHGYFDGHEREFRGFGMVEQRDTEEYRADTAFPGTDTLNWDEASWSPPALTRTWFHTGAFEQASSVSQVYAHEYWPEPGPATADRRAFLPDSALPAGLPGDELREACRALKGQMLRSELYAADGSPAAASPYTVTEHNFLVRRLQPTGPNRHAAFHVTPRESISASYERVPTDPRVTHELTLETDPYGNPVRSVSVGYPRRPGQPSPEPALSAAFQGMLAHDQSRLHVIGTQHSYTNPLTDPSTLPDAHRTPLPSATTTAEITGAAPSAAEPGGTSRFGFGELDAIWQQVWDGAHDIPYEAVPASDVDGTGAPATSPTRRVIDQTRTLYRSDDLTALLPEGTLDPLALPGESYRAALTPGQLAAIFGPLLPPAVLAEGGYVQLPGHTDWTAPSGRLHYSAGDTDLPGDELAAAQAHFFVPRRAVDPFGAVTRVAYDPYDLLPASVTDAVGNAITAASDYRVLQPAQVTDPNGNRAAVAFDTLAQVAGTAVMGKATEQLGDSLTGFVTDPDDATVLAHLSAPLANPAQILASATTRILYDHDAYYRTRTTSQPAPPAVYTLARETHVSNPTAGQVSRYQHTFSYADGFGREIQRKAQAEPGPLIDGGPDISPRWVGSGWTVFNNKAKPVRVYEPFFSATSAFQFAAQAGVSDVVFYDPPGRQIGVLHPDSTWQKVVFDPWHQEAWDRNDTVLIADPRSDPDLGGHFLRLIGSTPGAFTSWHDRRITGTYGATPDERAAQQEAAGKAAAHAGTPTVTHFDALGRTCLTVEDNGSAGRYPARIALDTEGKPLAVWDALGRRAAEHLLRVPAAGGAVAYLSGWDLAGNPLYQNGMDGGARRGLVNVAGQQIRRWDARGHAFRASYDASQRPTHLYVSTDGAPEVLLERSVYGEGHADLNLCGRPSRRYDTAGVAFMDHYDFKGNMLRSARQLAADYRRSPDWSALAGLTDPAALDAAAAPQLAPADRFDASTIYDALNRPIQTVTPHSAAMSPNVLRPSYSVANLLEALDVWVQQAGAPTVLLDPSTADLHAVAAIHYNARGQRTQAAAGNGTVTTYSYDPFTFRLTHLTASRPATLPASQRLVQDLSYYYDPAGNITRIRDAADTQNVVFFRNQRVEPSTAYTYDPLYRLQAATGREHLGQTGGALPPPQQITNDDSFRTRLPHPGDGNAMGTYTETYAYDPVGNLLAITHQVSTGSWTRRYAYAESSQITPAETGNRLSATSLPGDPAPGPYGATYSHDTHGNMLRMPHLPAITWDEQDRLASSSRQAITSGTPETTFYSYDAVGQRIRKATDRQAPPNQPPARRAARLYLGAVELYREFGADGATVTLQRETLHIDAPSQTVVLIETRTLGTSPPPAQLIRYQHLNHLGSAVLELDAQAQIITYEEYFPYGDTSYQAVRSQTETPKRLRYTGKERDEESGLYYYGARYYAPWLARWTSVDVAKSDGALTLYAYVSNNPIVNFDPNGKWGVSMHFAAVYWAGRMEGVSHREALAVAIASQSLDDFFFTAAPDMKRTALFSGNPVLMTWANNSHALNVTRETAELVAQSGIRSHDMALFGFGLHTVGDYLPHANLSGKWTFGHQEGLNEDYSPSSMWSPAADETFRNPRKALATFEHFRSLWSQFQGQMGPLEALNKGQLQRLSNFLYAENPDEMVKALQAGLAETGVSEDDIRDVQNLLGSKEDRQTARKSLHQTAAGQTAWSEAVKEWSSIHHGTNSALYNHRKASISQDLKWLPKMPVDPRFTERQTQNLLGIMSSSD